MAIQMKRDGDNDENENTGLYDSLSEDVVSADGYYGGSGKGSSGRGGYGDDDMDSKYHNGKPDLNDLPTYTGPTAMPQKKEFMNASKSTLIFKIVAAIVALVVLGLGIYAGRYMAGSGGKEIGDKLTMTEDEISKDMGITFEDNANKANYVPRYSNGTVTVRTGKELSVVYIDGKQAGYHTTSRKYRFFGVGINDPDATSVEKMTYNYENSFVVLNDLMGGKSSTYFYYNKKENTCLVLTISDSTNRVVAMTYYTNMKKATETLSGIGE